MCSIEKTLHIWHKETKWLYINVFRGLKHKIHDTKQSYFLTQPTELAENNRKGDENELYSWLYIYSITCLYL